MALPVFTIKKQGEMDYACSLYCVLSAAIHLDVLPKDCGTAKVLAHPEVPRDLPQRLLTKGATETEVRCIAQGAGLLLQRQNNPTLDVLKNIGFDSHVWVALVWMTFDEPAGSARRGGDRLTTGTERDEKHYVLVLDVTSTRVVVADPHPWHRDVYSMTTAGFERAWTRREYRWAARLTPS